MDSTHDDILKSPSESNKSTSPEITTPIVTKKVSLKRNISIAVPTVETKPAEEIPESAAEVSSGESDKKIVKVSELTAQDRLELRAKKFCLGENAAAQPESDRLQARAARFGAALSPQKSTDKPVTSSVSLDILKKRAERFGTVLVPELKKSENQEKLQKRQERFGASGKVEITAPSGTSSEYADKAAKRLERFKQAA